MTTLLTNLWNKIKAFLNTDTGTGILIKMENEMARITDLPDGTYTLLLDGAVIGTYTRKRDAVRGAARRGIDVA